MDYRLTIHGHLIRVYVDSPRAQADAQLALRMQRVEGALNLLPEPHVSLIVEPIVVVDRLPGGRATGGGWFAARSTSAWTSPSGARNTGVSPETMRARIAEGGDTGVIGITSAAFLKSDNWGAGHWACEFTLLHEVGHSVDHHAGLIPRAPVPDRYGNGPFQGMRYPDGGVGELAAEAYSRFFLRPSAMCRGGAATPPCVTPAGVSATGACPNQLRCSGRLQRDLRAAPAFAGSGVVFPLALSGDLGGAKTPLRPSVSNSREMIAGVNTSCSWMQPGPLGDHGARDTGRTSYLFPASSGRATCGGHS